MVPGRPPSPTPSVKRMDLAQELGKELGTFSAGAKVVHAFFDEIKKALVAGEKVSIHGLGRFKIIAKAARNGRNPRTGEDKLIKSRNSLSFKPSTLLREQLGNADLAKSDDD